jgi:hypothetical protein
MRRFFRLLVLFLLIFGIHTYLSHNNISIREVIDKLISATSRIKENLQTVDQGTELSLLKDQVENIEFITTKTELDNSDRASLSSEYAENNFAGNLTLSSGTIENHSGENENETVSIKGEHHYDLQWIKEVTQKHSSNSWSLLQAYDQLPSNLSARTKEGAVVGSTKSTGTFHYLRFNSVEELLRSMATNVHEISHGFASLNIYKYANENNIFLDWNRTEVFIYLAPTETFFVSVPKSCLFPTKKIKESVPERLRTFRFSAYVDGETSTQGDGIVGLLDEFHAYYLGCKFTFDVKDVYLEVFTSPAEGLLSWVSRSQSQRCAFYEFDFFIMEYLLYMKKNATEDYFQLLGNQEFVQAYKSTHKLYRNLLEDYKNSIGDEISELNEKGNFIVSIEDNKIWIQRNGSLKRSGTLIISDDEEVLKPILLSSRYDEIRKDLQMNRN